jgi:hypothetical protein
MIASSPISTSDCSRRSIALSRRIGAGWTLVATQLGNGAHAF